nr:hypothetical protein [Treponema sp.]
MTQSPFYFGVRHLSPAAGIELRSFLEEKKPELVLVEGPSDLNYMIDSICDPKVRFPIAVMAYTEKAPVRSILYPFAEYSPEVQALLWAKKNGSKVEFMDLPSSVFLAMPSGDEKESEGTTESVYKRMEVATGESHESWWERTFEQLGNTGKYREAANAFGRELRKAEKSQGRRDTAETLVREAFMKKKIEAAIKSGTPPEKIVCVCGAFHVGGLEENEAMTDEEAENLPKANSFATLMPYSFFRLSSMSGYGAGNESPSYYQMMFDAFTKGIKKGESNDEIMKGFVTAYIVECAKEHRNAGNIVSAASLIETERLAYALSAIRGGRHPNIEDLDDAMTATIGHGDFSKIVYATTKVKIRPVVGYLPQGMSKTAVQDDFNRQLEKLKLEKHRSEVVSEIELDLREKLSAQSDEAAFRDLYRSFFLNRLSVIGVNFARIKESGQSNMNWKEVWSAQWLPEVEIELVEASLMGDSIKGVCASRLKEMTDEAQSMDGTAEVFGKAFQCGLPDMCAYALKKVQALSTEDNALFQTASTADRLSTIVRYGTLRKFDTETLEPMVEKLYLRSILIMKEACRCDDENARKICSAIDSISKLQLNHSSLDEQLLLDTLYQIAEDDSLNCRCSGFSMSLLLERGKCGNDKLSAEISRRLSKGTPPDLAALWFEGLSEKNHFALIARIQIWEELNKYIDSLDNDEFDRSLVVLRRTFAEFSQNEKCEIAENLGEIWGTDKGSTAEVLTQTITEADKKKIGELSDFDFDDI